MSFVQDAVLESFNGELACVVTMRAAAPGDELVMLFRTRDGSTTRRAMRVCSSTPIVQDSSRAYRLELRASDAADPPRLALLAHL